MGPLFASLAMAAERCMSDFNAIHLASTAWAFAKAGHLDAKVFMLLASEAKRRVGDFDAKHIANTAWAFAKAS